MMKFVGGYNLLIEGKPSGEITRHADPDVLHLPLTSRGLDFSALRVENGDAVKRGQILAGDPVHYFAPLLAPMNGTVNLKTVEGHVTLENLSGPADASADDRFEKIDHEDRRQTLLRLGIWSFMAQVSDGRLPDPETTPEALIIATTRFEPFFPSPDVFLMERLDRFADGLLQLHKTLGNTTVYLVIPQAVSEIGSQLRRLVSENSTWMQLFEVPERYPCDNPALAAQMLELKPETVWTLDAQAVLGAEQALNHGRPYVTRVVSVSGPAAGQPVHYRLPTGYPLSSLVEQDAEHQEVRIIDGGVLTGRAITTSQKGLDAECVALTVLKENTEREVLAFAQAGSGKHSYSRSFVSVLKPLFREKYTTAMRGEARPCLFCGYCEDVCPAGLIPHVIYRYLDNDRPEDAVRAGLHQCVECGLCSYVCLSKIEHLRKFREEKAKIAMEAKDE